MKKLVDLDFIGMAASVLCLIHCLALPWLIALAGTFLGSYVESPQFHNVMLVLAIAIGLPVFIVSFMKYKSKLILATGVSGLALTAFGTIQEDPCCPPVTSAKVEQCASSACETACESTLAAAKVEECASSACEAACENTLAAAKVEQCASSACETACESTLAAAKVEQCESSACETACEDSSTDEPVEVAKTIDLEEPAILQGFNTIPLGVTLLLLAHFLNFRKKRSCSRACCDTE